MAFGFGISVLVFVTSPLSGGHLNPAVTCSFALLGHIHPVLALWYLVAQMVGAVLGAGLVYGTFSSTQLQYLSGATPTPPFLLGMNSVTPGISLGSAFLGETMGTLLLVFTVLMTAAYQHVSGRTKWKKVIDSIVRGGSYISSFSSEHCRQSRSHCYWLVRLPCSLGIGPYHWLRNQSCSYLWSNGRQLVLRWTKHLIQWLVDLLRGSIGGLTDCFSY